MTSDSSLALDREDRGTINRSDLAGMWAILTYGKGSYLRLAGAIFLIILSAAAVMVSARILGRLVESVIAGGREAEIWHYTLVFLSLETASVVSQYFGRMSLARLTIEITYRVRCELFAKLRRLPITYFDFQPLGRTITRLTSDVEGIETFFNGTLARLLTSSIQVIAVLVAMLVTDINFGMIIVAASLPSLIFSVSLRGPVRRWMRVYKQRSAFINAKLAEYLNGMPVIKIFGLENWTQKNFEAAAGSMFEAGLWTMHWNSFIRPMAVLLCSLPTVCILWLGGERVIQGTMAVGLVVAFVRYSERFISPIRMISQEIQNIQEALVASERVLKMLAEPEELDSLGPDGDLTLPIRGDVEYRDVWMSYESSSQPVLKGISFKVKQGMTVGLVGATGSGKTTTINMLPSLYPFQKGEILVDGQPLQRWRREHLRSQLGYVSQDVVVFSGTIRENLLATASSEQKFSDEMILAACEKTGLSRILANFDNGLDHYLVDGGDNLSMGERQLIAFTRMLLRNPSILILDEATANVDASCELLIQKAIGELMAGRTSFVIAHRLSTIIQCDLILVFKGGRIVEHGCHEELMGQDGHYRSLASRQLMMA